MKQKTNHHIIQQAYNSCLLTSQKYTNRNLCYSKQITRPRLFFKTIVYVNQTDHVTLCVPNTVYHSVTGDLDVSGDRLQLELVQ